MTKSDPLYGRQLGDFTLLDCIDEGGFGAVYRCEQPLLGREAVVKVMHERVQADEAARRRFSAEARLAARLEHPYAAHVYAHGIEEDGLVWIAMELVHGVSLKQYLDEHSSMSLEAFVPFFEQLAEVVHAAHEQGIVHRDLKPANVMMTRGRMPKLLDFGAAKLLTDSVREAAGLPCADRRDATERIRTGDLTPPDGMIGTAAYSSPELWVQRPVSPAADVYALGIIAYEVLTGRRPFRAESLWALGTAHLHKKIPLCGNPALDRIFARALAKQPEDRYESATEFAAALRGVLDGRQRQRAARRMGAFVGALLATVIVGGAVGQSRYERRMAEQRAADAQEMAHWVTLTAELEQGRAALLGGDMQGAQQHLDAAWRMGSRDRATQFMLDRAMQPRRAELAKLEGTGRMWSASWSPDGRWIATTDDWGAQIWDGTTYTRLSPLPHGDTVYSAVWAGDRLVTACGDGSVRVWDAARGSLVRELRIKGRSPRWYALAVSRGRVAAVDAKGDIAAVWGPDGRPVTEIQLDGDERPAIAFSADGDYLATGGGTTVHILATAAWRQVISLSTMRIAWDQTRPRLVTGAESGELSIWSMPGGKRLRIRESGSPVDAVAFSPDGARVAAALRDGTSLVFDAADGSMVSACRGGHGRQLSLDFSPDGASLAGASATGIVAVCDALTGAPSIAFDAPTSAAYSVRFSSDGQRAIAATWDGAAWVWSAVDPYQRWRSRGAGGICGVIGSAEPDGRYLPVSCAGHATKIWDVAHDRLLAELPPIKDSDRPTYPIVSADGARAAIAQGLEAEVYEIPGGRLVRTVQHRAAVTALAFTSDGKLVSGDADGAVLVDDAERFRSVAGIDATAILPGDRIAAADARGRVRIDGLGEIDAGARARMLRLSPSGDRLLVVPSYKGPAVAPALVSLEHGTVSRLVGPQVYTARWTQSGILTAHADGSARLWGESGALRRTFRGGRSFLVDAALTTDGEVVGIGGDGSMRFWDASTGFQLWSPSAPTQRPFGLAVGPWGIAIRSAGGDMSRWVLPDSAYVFSRR